MTQTDFFNKLTDVCHSLIYSDKKTFKYINGQRGLSLKTIRDYKIGYFPKDLRVLFNYMDPTELKAHDIIWDTFNSPFKYGLRKKIHYPLVIPIMDVEGKAVAIGCRLLESEKTREKLGVPKYKNSKFHKSAYLFGLNKAIPFIRELDKVFVVEGYLDVLSCHQKDIRNVVASCGTAFTERQLILLSRYTNNITLLFDNDVAGEMSTKRALEVFGGHPIYKVNLSCKFTPKGFKDIDEYLRAGGSVDFFI